MARNPERDRKIGAAMRALRRRSSLTDAQVARRMGYGPHGRHQIDRWERGERGITASRLWSYLETVGATFGDLDVELGLVQPNDPVLEEIAQQLQDLGKSTKS